MSHATPPAPSFADFALPSALLDALRAAGIDTPFPVQTATLPDALAGRDVLGRAQTGSGKTLAFGLAMLAGARELRQQHGRPRQCHTRGLVLVPTRELAMQVADTLKPLAEAIGLRCGIAVGGMPFTRQASTLARGLDLLIATPGRLSDHVRQGTANLDDIAMITLDEADQMADMGFLPQITEILDGTPRVAQRMLFSASLDGAVNTLVRNYLNDPVEHSVGPATASVTTMDHHVLVVPQQHKRAVITEIAAREGRTILFVRTKQNADRLADTLRGSGVAAVALHGGKPQGQRNRVLDAFRHGAATTLVATDVAARGIHVDGVSLVLHVDPPADAKDYLHRAGRTARAGASGTVATVITSSQQRGLRKMFGAAGVRPETATVQPGAGALARITGARTPSGTPVPEPQPPTRRRGGRPGNADHVPARNGRRRNPHSTGGARGRKHGDRQQHPRRSRSDQARRSG
ncbi:DEAD/DEAH box helicase [Haloechinothrix sp. LS1_15]|uniref:DEAD/DEAH box helicase n=1 Tax=Haloechinothrix sp. LS1_15 TaxID=2652248 RepID=UPI00294AD73A|nr:DEAD/DEAH box helicase [Haloechinothrix sp. LS1_15]